MDFIDGLKCAFCALKEKKLYADYLAFMLLGAFFYVAIYSLPSLAPLLIIPFALVFCYFMGKFLHYRLSQEKLAATKYDLDLYLKYLAAVIAQTLHTIFFWREKRLLLLYLIPIMGALLFFSSISATVQISGASKAFDLNASGITFPAALLLLAGIVLLFIAFVYASYRLCFLSQLKLCSPKMELGECSQRSWSTLHSHVLTVFLYALGFTICAGIPIALISALFAFAFHSALLQRILDGVFAPFFYGMYSFLLVYLYKEIGSGKFGRKKAAKKTRVPRRKR